MAITIDSISPICLDEFRKWGSFDPLLFNTLDHTECYEKPIELPPCEHFVQHVQQDKFMSRELLAQRLCECAEEIKTYLGTFVSPTWTSETHKFENFWQIERRKQIAVDPSCVEFQTDCWNVNDFGQPLYTNHETVTTVANDVDGDGYNETHTIIFQLPVGIMLDELKYYFSGRTLKSGLPDQHYEICSIRSTDYDANTNEVCVVFDSFNLVEPSLYITHTWQAIRPLNACGDIYVNDIEVWSETLDPCAPQVEVFWHSDGCTCNGSGTCGRCDVIRRFACVRVIDTCEGLYSFQYVGMDEDGCPDPTSHCPDIPCYLPSYFKVYYNAGITSKAVNRALFMLTASHYQFLQSCHCDCLVNLFSMYNQVLIIADSEERFSFNNLRAKDLAQMPFSPTVGGLEAYRILREIKRCRCE